MNIQTCKDCGATFLVRCPTCSIGLVVVTLPRPAVTPATTETRTDTRTDGRKGKGDRS